MSKSWNDHEILYQDTPEEKEIREEQEKLASNRKDVYGAHMSYRGKGGKAFQVTTKVSTSRMKKQHIDTNSKTWKDYIDKKISFQEMKRLLKIK